MFQKVVQTATHAEAGLIRSRLLENGFHPPEIDTAAHVTVAGDERFYYVELPEEEVPAACRFLREAGLEPMIVVQ